MFARTFEHLFPITQLIYAFAPLAAFPQGQQCLMESWTAIVHSSRSHIVKTNRFCICSTPKVCACKYRTCRARLPSFFPISVASCECESSSVKASPSTLVGRCRAVPNIELLWFSVSVVWCVGRNSAAKAPTV